MKSAVAFLGLAAGSHALVAREEHCCSGITAYGGPSGSVGQLRDGQNRLGDNRLPLGRYCLGANGGITDEKGRGTRAVSESSHCSILNNGQAAFSLPQQANGSVIREHRQHLASSQAVMAHFLTRAR